MKVKNYQELIAWQKSMDLVEEVYKSSRDFPREEIYALTSTRLEEPLFRFRQTSPRVKEEGQHLTSFVICRSRTVR